MVLFKIRMKLRMTLDTSVAFHLFSLTLISIDRAQKTKRVRKFGMTSNKYASKPYWLVYILSHIYTGHPNLRMLRTLFAFKFLALTYFSIANANHG